MARSSYSDARSLPDPLLSYNFDLIIANVPGGGDTRALKIKCQSTEIPGTSVEDVSVFLHGVELKYAGRQTWTHTLSAQYLETRDMSTRFGIKNWIEYARNARQNTGRYKSQYATIADLLLYDDAGLVIRTIRMEGFFPQSLQETGVDGSNSAPVIIPVTFYYDAAFDL